MKIEERLKDKGKRLKDKVVLFDVQRSTLFVEKDPIGYEDRKV